ncbi:TetR/AcrR family transcriptional regulator [Ktedonosporobacter rubrisoli]|uniref:TetR/AcrR family transcriptional regulator n=1 Tax=Ktedonosporobacter rubrisoli TaxID=2509675 RepID=A0A4P6JQW8_KTERU|nr:TetR/AcrR family transcriptional regulator [Ktedonosporobacter rubrisoli]QBD77828.1 TetR/AcrR family transcriptional regulator [Ktedonosporobacter rubrisoli]
MDLKKSNAREDPRVLRTRKLLLQAFSELFVEKGFYAMTVQDITERASVNRGTFYTHFEDKPAILECWLREQFQEHIARKVLSSEPLSASTIRLLVGNVIEWFAQLHQLTRSADRALIPLVVTTLQEALFELLWQGLKPAAGSGVGQRVDVETVAMVTSWAIFGAGFQCFNQWDGQTTTVPADELADQVTSTLLGGLAQALPAFSLT